ncbi:hypothetical protein COLO4_35518 [Corchorus olitorius]|uniref:Nucleic acid-binding protein n=1 Tax=Corchorus olitorius TaxID=93759 RepID=A0A1R3GFZ2_9ROSI|nr:hypothetical protein COLO4_35518 [Corchorus olitorius]
MAFVATDHSGNGIHVQIAERDMGIFKPLLIEGALYDITRFRIGAPTVRYIASPSSYAMFLSKSTVLNPINEDVSAYPGNLFDFTAENHLPYLANRDKFLAGMIVRTINGDPFLTSCSASKIYVNLDIQEVGLIQMM